MFYAVMSGQLETVELFFQSDHRDFTERLWVSILDKHVSHEDACVAICKVDLWEPLSSYLTYSFIALRMYSNVVRALLHCIWLLTWVTCTSSTSCWKRGAPYIKPTRYMGNFCMLTTLDLSCMTPLYLICSVRCIYLCVNM